jgi:upstream activation factor subunit UAF30
LETLNTFAKQVKDLTMQVKNLQKHVYREQKDLEKAAKGKRKKVHNGDKPKRAPSGFAKPTKLSPELCEFLGIDPSTEMARTEVTKKITTYVKDNNLQNPEAKKEILPDEKLGKLLNVPNDDKLTYFNLQKYMKVHFMKNEQTSA